jgi:Helicase HerA, central domain/TraM recognition site of TraD and TraG
MTLPPLIIGRGQELYRMGDVCIDAAARRRHLAIFGTSGSGKSGLLRTMIAEDIAAGLGVTVIDPHGQLCEEILDSNIPGYRTNDVIHVNPKDLERAFALNMLHCPRPEQRGLVVSNVISIFKKLWADSWGNRLEYILRNSLYALIVQPKPVSILALPELLTDPAYRQTVLANVSDAAILRFFQNVYDRWPNSFREEAISPVLNRCGAFTTDPLLRAVIGQPRSSFDFRWAIDRNKIILCDLSKGRVGSDNGALLGSLIVMQEFLAALSRADMPESERVPHVLYCDEAQNFIGDFESILAEARKYKLVLALATQGIESLADEAVSAIFTNCGTLISFRVSSTDATRLRDELAALFPGASLQELPDFSAYFRTLTCDDNRCDPTEPLKITTYPPPPRFKGNAAKMRIMRRSAEAYTRPRAEVEAAIADFLRGSHYRASADQSVHRRKN